MEGHARIKLRIKPENSFLFLINILSLRCHHDLLKCEIERFDSLPRAVDMCETWLLDDDHLGLYYLGLDYQKIITRNKQGKKGGGIAAFVIEGLHYREWKRKYGYFFSDKTDELVICILYRPPSLLFGKFLEELENLLFDLNSAYKNILLCWDMNVNILDQNSK